MRFVLLGTMLACGGTDPVDTGTWDPEADPDGDGLTNAEEQELGTDPHNNDTDGDGWKDGKEVKTYTNPLDADDHPYTGGWAIDACRDVISPTGTEVGDVQDDFALTDQFGESVRLHSFCDRVVVVASLQPGDEASEGSGPEFQRWFFENERAGLMVLVLLGPDAGTVDQAEWVEEHEVTHPVLLDPGWEVTARFTGADPSVPTMQVMSEGALLRIRNRMASENEVLAILGE